MKKVIIGVLVFLSIWSCKKEEELSFSYYEIDSKDCTNCAKVSMNLPKAISKSEVSHKINTGIENTLIELLNFAEKENPENLTDAIALFEKSYFEMVAEYSESPDWEFTADGEITYEGPELICVEISTYMFTGGAHGSTANHFILFNPGTGEILKVEEIFKDLKGFKDLAEKKFRIQEGIAADATINSTGYLFEEDTFKLPENIGFEENNLILLYNQYEIASYADGEIIVEIPLKEIIPFMKIQPLLE